MDTLPAMRRLPWIPGTVLLMLAAMIGLIVFATDTLHIVIGVGLMIVLSLLGGIITYRVTLNRARSSGKRARPPRYQPPVDPNAPTDYMPNVSEPPPPLLWPPLLAFARAAPFFGIGLAFCFHYQIASDLWSARPASDLFSIISITVLALGFAIGLAARPYAVPDGRGAWWVWAALTIVITEWVALFMFLTATFNGSYRSAIAPAVVALGAVFPLLLIARDLMDRRYSAQAAGMTLSGPGTRPSRRRALWRSGGTRFVVGAVGLLALAVYIIVAAPQLNGPSIVVRVWPLILVVVCVLVPRGKADEAGITFF